MNYKKMEEDYLAKGGVYCPRCYSVDIDSGSTSHCGDYISQGVHCHRCGFEWADIFTLTGIKIEEIESEPDPWENVYG